MKDKLSGLAWASAKHQRRTGHVHANNFKSAVACTELFLDALSGRCQHLVGHLQLQKAM